MAKSSLLSILVVPGQNTDMDSQSDRPALRPLLMILEHIT